MTGANSNSSESRTGLGRSSDRLSYELVVRGEFARLQDMFATFPMCVETGDELTRLTGTFADQAELFGVLRQLRDLGLTLVSLTSEVDPESTFHPPQEAALHCQPDTTTSKDKTADNTEDKGDQS
ncbi:MAG: hypothetical protein ACPGYX_08270 [Oceanobacter sp.]